MGDKTLDKISFAAHEADLDRLFDIIKSLIRIIVLLVLLLVGSNVGWIVYEAQFEDVVTTYQADSKDGGTAVANGDGSVNVNGISEGNNEEAGS